MNLKEVLGDSYKDGMTFDEISTALEAFEMPKDQSAEIERMKNAVSKANGEAAEYKRQLKAKMSDDERTANEKDEAFQKLQESYNALTKQVAVSDNKAKLLAMGYAEELAGKTAVAMADGDMAQVMSYQAEHLKAYEKIIASRTLKNTPKPEPDGEPDGAMTKAKLMKMSPAERYRYSVDHPEEYKQLYT